MLSWTKSKSVILSHFESSWIRFSQIEVKSYAKIDHKVYFVNILSASKDNHFRYRAKIFLNDLFLAFIL